MNYLRHALMFQWLNLAENSHILKRINQKGLSTPNKVESFLKSEFEGKYKEFIYFCKSAGENELFRGLLPEEKPLPEYTLVNDFPFKRANSLKEVAKISKIPSKFYENIPEEVIKKGKNLEATLQDTPAIYLTGITGSGKTHSSIACAMRYCRKIKEKKGEYPSLYFFKEPTDYTIGMPTEPIINNGHTVVLKAPKEITCVGAEILIIDDFLLTPTIPCINFYLNILNIRQEMMSYMNIKTIFTSNFSIKHLESLTLSQSYGNQDEKLRISLDRLTSRLSEFIKGHEYVLDDIDHRRIWG